VFGLGRGSKGEDLEWFETKVGLFGLKYIRVNLWGKLFEVCNWCNIVKDFFNFLKCIKCKFTNLINNKFLKNYKIIYYKRIKNIY